LSRNPAAGSRIRHFSGTTSLAPSSQLSTSYQPSLSSQACVLSVAPYNEVLTRLSPRNAVSAARAIPRAPSPPPTLANTESRAASPALFSSAGPSRGGDDTWVYHRATYVASPTVAMSSPERSPERPPLTLPPRNTNSQASGSQPCLSQLPVSI
jgi:hypothetical protein